MPTRWKVSKSVRLTLYLAETLLAMALAALIVMSTTWFQHWLEVRVIAGMEDLTGGKVEISHFRFNPWLFHIRLQGLVIHGLEPAGDPPLFSVRDVEAGLSPEQLVHHRLRLRFLDMDQFMVHLHTNTQGITNLPGPVNRTSAQTRLKDLMDLSIGRLTISHSAFFWNDQQQPVEIVAGELAIILHMTRGHYSGTFSSSATTLRTRLGTPPPITLNGRFELSSASLTFSPLAWEAQGTQGEATFTVLLRPDLQATGSFHASAEIPALARLLHAPDLRTGSLQAEGVAVYQDGAFSARGRAQARQTTILTSFVPSLRFDATTAYEMEKSQLNLTNLVVSVWGGTVQGSLQMDFQDSRTKFHLNSRLHQIRLDNALRSPGTPPLLATQLRPASLADGALNANWSGRGEDLKADFDLALHAPPAPARDVLPVSGTARGTFEDEGGFILHLTDSEFQTPHSTVTARGTFAQKLSSPGALEPLDFTITTDDFEEWRPFFRELVATPSGIPLELKSRAEFSGQLSGGHEAPALQGRVSVGQFRYYGWTWDRLTAAVALNRSSIQISAGRVEHGTSSFELNATAQLENWRLTPSDTVHISSRAQRTPLDGLKAALNLDLPVRGSISGRVEVDGTTANLAGSGTVRIDDGAVEDEPFDSFSAQMQVAHSVWKLHNLLLQKKQGRLSGDVTLEPERRFASGQLQGSGFRLADIRRLPLSATNPLHHGGLEGGLNFDVRGQGTPEDFHLQSSWRLLNVNVAGTTLGEFHGTLTGEGKQIRLEAEGKNPGGDLHLSAATTAAGDWPMEAEGEYSKLRADPWIHGFFNREFGAAVTLGGSFRAAGPLRTPEKIDLQSHAQDLAVDFPSVQWRNAQPVDMHYSGGKIALSRFVMRGPATELNIEGTIGCIDGVTLALSADGSANATLLTVFDPNLQATGRSTLRLRLTGTPQNPLLNGAIEIQDMSLGYSQLPFRFNNLQGAINLEGERAIISSLRGTSGGGNVTLTGFVTLAASPRYEVRAALSSVRVRYPSSFTSVLNGNLRLVGGAEEAQLQGELVVRQMVLNENVNIINKIIESSNVIVEEPSAINSAIASKVRLNVRVTSAPPVQLQTPSLRLVGDIDLRVQGTVDNPVAVGSIHLLSGESIFRGNRYTLERGDINMTNPFRTQAYLDLEAQTRVQTYDLTLDISGPFDRLKFSYRSDPPLANSDIVSLLALGYVGEQGSYSTAGGNPATSIGASAILSEALSSEKSNRITHLFGVSRIKIDPNVSVPGFGSGARITVEQQVTHDFTLTYVTDTSYSQYQIIQFEWNISDKVSVLGVRDQNGVFGIEFRFRHRFK